MRAVTRVAVGAVAVVSILGVGFVVAFRTTFAPVQDRVRRFNRDVTNRRVLETAGAPGASASVLEHVGRSSGRTYQTPVAAMATDDGFTVVLPYGPGADWVRNVLSAGGAVIVHEGIRHELDAPAVVDVADVDRYVSATDRRVHGLFGVDQALVLHHV